MPVKQWLILMSASFFSAFGFADTYADQNKTDVLNIADLAQERISAEDITGWAAADITTVNE